MRWPRGRALSIERGLPPQEDSLTCVRSDTVAVLAAAQTVVTAGMGRAVFLPRRSALFTHKYAAMDLGSAGVLLFRHPDVETPLRSRSLPMNKGSTSFISGEA